MKKVVVGLSTVMFFLFSSIAFSYTESDKEPLFEMNGKKYYLKDLSLSTRNYLQTTEYKNYQMISSLLEEVLLDKYFEKIAASKKITVDQAMEAEFKVVDPSEKEIKKFYESQKANIPSSYKYDQIKPRLKEMLTKQKMVEKRNNLVAKLKKQHKFKLLIEEPLPVVVNIDTTGFPSKGDPSSKVKVVQFGAYGCVHCRHFNDSVKTLLKKEKINFVFIPFTLSPSPMEADLVKGGICADKQNKFWQYLDLAFDNQRTLSEESVRDFAKKLKLDMSKYEACLSSSEVQVEFERMKKAGKDAEVDATPTIFINNKKHVGGTEVKELQEAIKKEQNILNGKK